MIKKRAIIKKTVYEEEIEMWIQVWSKAKLPK
jgi:hypothetical protein